MGCAREYPHPTAPNWNDRLVSLAWCVATTRTLESAGRPMGEEFGAVLGSEPAESAELFEVVVTPDEWHSEVVQKQERDALSSW